MQPEPQQPFVNNHAAPDKGVINLQAGTLKLSGPTFLGNEGSLVQSTCDGNFIDAQQTAFTNNNVKDLGVILLLAGKLNLMDSTLAGNVGNGITFGEAASATINHCTFADNVAAGEQTLISVGADSGPIIFEGCSFRNNNAARGGVLVLPSSFDSVNMTNCSYYDNNAATNGGVFFAPSCASGLHFEAPVFSGNTAQRGAVGLIITTKPLWRGTAWHLSAIRFSGNETMPVTMVTTSPCSAQVH